MIERLLRGRTAILIVAVSYSLFLWRMSVPMTGDQKVYLSIALEMREQGEWIIPSLFGRPNFLKPPLQYWATLCGWKTFGFGIFGALFPSVIALILSGWLTVRAGAARSMLPLVFFCSFLSSMTYGTTAQMEIWLVLFYLLSWVLWIRGREISAWVSTGILAWVKGPLYPALWVITAAIDRILCGRTREIFRIRTGLGLSLGIAIGLSWYLLAARTHLQEMLAVFLLRENLGKLSTSQGSPLGLWSEFLATLFPLLPWLLVSLGTPEFREKARRNGRFWISFGVVPAVFFTFFPYRVNTYLYLLTPLAAMMLSEEPPKAPRVLIRSVQGMVAILFFGALFLGYRLTRGGWLSLPLAGFAALALIVWGIGHWRLRPGTVGLGALLLVTAIRLGAVEIGEWDLKGLRQYHSNDPAPLAYWIDREDIWHEFGLVSAALGEPVGRVRSPEEREKWLAAGGALILSDEQTTEELRCVDWNRLKRRLRFPLRELLTGGLSIEDPSLHRVFRLCRRPSS